MSETRTGFDEDRQRAYERPAAIQTVVRRFGVLHVLAGLLALLGPVEGNDDRGLVNTEPGLFLGVVAVNGRHALLHILYGTLSVRAGRDAESARRFAGVGGVFFAALAAVGWRRFGFERGVHVVAGLAVDGWGNLGHALIAAFNFRTVLRSCSRS